MKDAPLYKILSDLNDGRKTVSQTYEILESLHQEPNLHIGQNLFNALIDVCEYTALQSEQHQIIEAVKADNKLFQEPSKEVILKVLKTFVSTEVNPNREYISAYVLEYVADEIQKALTSKPDTPVEKERGITITSAEEKKEQFYCNQGGCKSQCKGCEVAESAFPELRSNSEPSQRINELEKAMQTIFELSVDHAIIRIAHKALNPEQ